MNKIYLVKYYGGSSDNYYQNIIFATAKKTKATKYVAKFNKILKKWKEYYSQYEDNRYGFKWIKDEYINKYYHRWDSLKNISKCIYEEVELR